jgi:hypothetical protein
MRDAVSGAFLAEKEKKASLISETNRHVMLVAAFLGPLRLRQTNI